MTLKGKDVTGFIDDPVMRAEASEAFITLALAVCLKTKNKFEAQKLVDNIYYGLSDIVQIKLGK